MTATKTVGLLLSPKKLKQNRLCSIAEHPSSEGLRFVAVDLSQPLEDHYDLILHKISDLIGKAVWCNDDKKAKAQFQRFKTFCESHPDMVILDPLDNVVRLGDRKRVLEKCISASALFRVPKAIYIDNVHHLPARIDLKYPLICKRRAACALLGSHEMVIVPGPDQLHEIRPMFEAGEAVVLQEFIPHDGVLVKVYVADGRPYVSFRPSFKNRLDDAVLPFNSQALAKSFDTVAQPFLVSDRAAEDHAKSILDYERIQNIADHLRQQLDLTFFGFDIILEADTAEYYVIDVNYFPSFGGVDDFAGILISTIKKRLFKH
ncbi:inositol-tetrakisphosphate 1-kinase [Dichotomocladium elegans]|nr:inositol-tetrakisphosphate 1-kinase [Dichotomocladium elegans]